MIVTKVVCDKCGNEGKAEHHLDVAAAWSVIVRAGQQYAFHICDDCADRVTLAELREMPEPKGK